MRAGTIQSLPAARTASWTAFDGVLWLSALILAAVTVAEAFLAGRLLVQVLSLQGWLADLAYDVGGWLQAPFATAPATDQIVHRGIFELDTIRAAFIYAVLGVAVPITAFVVGLTISGYKIGRFVTRVSVFLIVNLWLALDFMVSRTHRYAPVVGRGASRAARWLASNSHVRAATRGLAQATPLAPLRAWPARPGVARSANPQVHHAPRYRAPEEEDAPKASDF
jgi:hypothetical protein